MVAEVRGHIKKVTDQFAGAFGQIVKFAARFGIVQLSPPQIISALLSREMGC
jgi:hypothetical protein